LIHLVKLCVGVESPDLLAKSQRQDKEVFHITRSFPRRAEELLAGGSLYWVFRGHIRARQRILALEVVYDELDQKKCKIVLARRLYLTSAWPHRPFQGWRYLDKPPPDLKKLV